MTDRRPPTAPAGPDPDAPRATEPDRAAPQRPAATGSWSPDADPSLAGELPRRAETGNVEPPAPAVASPASPHQTQTAPPPGGAGEVGVGPPANQGALAGPPLAATRGAGPITLDVAPTAPRDCGRAILRLAPADMTALGARAGDVVRILGPGRAHARVLPARPDAAQAGSAPLDPAQREGAGLALGDAARLEQLDAPPDATQVALRKAPGTPSPDLDALRAALAHVPVGEDETLHATLPGGGR